MADTKHTLIEACIALIAVAGIALAFWTIPARYDAEVIQGYDAPPSSLIAIRSSPLVVQLPHSEKPLAGVVIYAASTPHKLRAHIQNEEGNILANKRFQQVQYKQDGLAAIHIYFEKKAFSETQKIFLSIEPYGDQQATFIATPEHNLVYSLLFAEPVSASTKQGILVGVAIAVSFIVMHALRLSQKQQWLLAGILVTGCSVLVTLPYTNRPGDWGIFDWDYRHSLSHIYQTTIREYGQLPLWNPYICGGTAALGDPEFALFTPSFLLQFLFGVENGTGISLTLGFIVTGLGVLTLAKRIGLDPFPALLSSIVMICSSSLMLKTTEGHTTILFAFMWVPWALWAWYRQRAFLCGLFLTCALLQGGIYILSYTAVAFAALTLLSNKKYHAFQISIYAFLWMVGLTSFQLIPSLLWVKEFPDQAFVGSAYTYNNLWDIFFGRYLQNVFIIPNQLSRWHEYGAYIGYAVFALVLVGVSYVKSSRIVQVLLFGLVTTVVISSLGPLFEPVLGLMKFLPRSNISRLALFTTLCAAFLAGFGVQRLLSLKSSYMRVLSLIVVGYIGIDLLSLAYPIAEEGFGVPRVSENLPQSPFPLTHTDETFTIRYHGSDTPRAYGATLKGYGTFSFCSVIGPQSAVTLSDMHNPSAFIQSTQDVETELVSWSPNKISFTYRSSHESDISVNTNYASGWNANYGRIIRNNPRLTVRVPPGEATITITYMPPGLLVGILISVLTLLYATIQFKHRIR